MRRDTGTPVVTEVGLKSDEAQGYERLAQASLDVIHLKPAESPSALQVFGGPAQEAEVQEQLDRIIQKPKQAWSRSERKFVAKHGDE